MPCANARPAATGQPPRYEDGTPRGDPRVEPAESTVQPPKLAQRLKAGDVRLVGGEQAVDRVEVAAGFVLVLGARRGVE